MTDKTMVWHNAPTEAVLQRLDVDPAQGLSAAEVAQRREQYGPNALVEQAGRSLAAMLLDQFRDVMVLVLIAASLVSFVLGETIDATVIIAIVIINAILGLVQEYRAEQAMAALKRMAAPSVRVRRDGSVESVPAVELVPGDIILVEAGDVISADSRLVEIANLRTEEASLTGESVPVSKHTNPIDGDDIPIGDRKNMVYMGTTANYGRGVAVVTATGMATEIGRIAELIQTVETEPTPLQRRMAELGKILAVAAGIIIAVVIVLGYFRGEDPKELFLTAIAMAVAAIPEGLPAVVTISLALGAQKMLSRNALIRKLPAVETLGSVTTICSDKTGTLTQNRMTVQVLDMAGHTMRLTGQEMDGVPHFELTRGDSVQRVSSTLNLLLVGSALCNDAILKFDPDDPTKFRTLGDPTEAALLVAALDRKLRKDELEKLFPRVAEVPFSSERKRMTTIHAVDHESVSQIQPGADALMDQDYRYVAFTKGAMDLIVEHANRLWVHDQLVALDDEWVDRIRAAHDDLAAEGQRVLGFAARFFRDLPDVDDPDSVESELVFVGLVGMIDPPRPEVAEAVAICSTAGIRPVMITGDHPITAKEIAKQLNIAKPGDRVVTGRELERMSLAELEAIVETVPVFARVSPEHKLNIVQALQNKGHITAMTGDGVNDAPALRKADIGVAMGITGTDVSKEAAEMVILDDNFATIVAAVKEGRTIYDNVRKFMQYIMTSNAGEIYVMLLAPFIGMPLPLAPLQILWVNLVTDGLPALALSVEPSESDTMKRQPFAPDESIFSRGIGTRILWAGLLMGLVSLLVGLAGFRGWLPTALEGEAFGRWWRTLVFTTLTLSQMGNALAVRSNRQSFFKIGPMSNPLMLAAVALTFLLQLAVIYVPFMQNIFGTVALTLNDLLLCLVLSTVVFWSIEAEKWFKRRRTPAAQ